MLSSSSDRPALGRRLGRIEGTLGVSNRLQVVEIAMISLIGQPLLVHSGLSVDVPFRDASLQEPSKLVIFLNLALEARQDFIFLAGGVVADVALCRVRLVRVLL